MTLWDRIRNITPDHGDDLAPYRLTQIAHNCNGDQEINQHTASPWGRNLFLL